MQDVLEIPPDPPLKLKKKEIKHQILEQIRLYMNIPDDVPRGGLEFRKYLKKNSKRLKMAKDLVLPIYNRYFKNRFTNQKLYRWAENNQKPHKRSFIQTIESKKKILKEASLKEAQGFARKDLQTELIPTVMEENPKFHRAKLSKAFVSRLMKGSGDVYQTSWKKRKVQGGVLEKQCPRKGDEELQFIEMETKRSVDLMSSFPEIINGFKVFDEASFLDKCGQRQWNLTGSIKIKLPIMLHSCKKLTMGFISVFREFAAEQFLGSIE